MRKEQKKNLFITILPIAFIFGMLTFAMLLDMYSPKINLIGDKEIYISINGAYSEMGANAISNSNDISSNIVMEGTVDTSQIGTYLVTYKVKKYGVEREVARTVHVVDDISPQIILEGEESIRLCPGDEFQEPGYSAFDNYDGDVTASVIISKDDDGLTYRVKDYAGNEMVRKRNVTNVDHELPHIALLGNSDIKLIVGSKYFESGYVATDNCDQDISKKVKITNPLNIQKTGTYQIKYEVTDRSGNVASAIRTVRVVNAPAPRTGTIYLTFDDGPSYITPLILNILKEEGVPATFFVLNRSDKYNYLLNRIVNEGHTIGLHGTSHNYRTVYASVNSYFNDIETIGNKVKNITGVDSKIMRFIGGSSNTVSKFNPGIMSTLTTEVANRGYRYYDWNVGTGDSGNVTSSQIYYNVVNRLGSGSTYIVLMHDMEGNYKTVNALRDIIRYGKNRGYRFSKITENTPQIKHRVAN